MIARMAEVKALLEGFTRFHAKHFCGEERLYEHLAVKQEPRTLIISCSDARVDPSILTDARPGDIFVVRNVANLVPPYQPVADSYHGTSAALEFAVKNLQVRHIVVLGHSGCAGIRALLDRGDTCEECEEEKEFSFISSWVDIAKEAKARALHTCGHSGEDPHTACEKEGIITSLENLKTFPWIRERIDNGTIKLHGWYFSLDDGTLQFLSDDGTYRDAALK